MTSLHLQHPYVAVTYRKEIKCYKLKNDFKKALAPLLDSGKNCSHLLFASYLKPSLGDGGRRNRMDDGVVGLRY